MNKKVFISSVLVKWNQYLLQDIHSGDGSRKFWFVQHSLPYGTDNEAIELNIMSFQEYKEFVNNTKIKHYKPKTEYKNYME